MQDYPIQKLEQSWVKTGITPEIVKWTDSFGKYLCAYEENNPNKKALTTGQLRKFFGEVKRIDADVIKHKAEVPMLKPLLAYAVGRDKKKAGRDMVNKTRIEEFSEELCKAIDAIRFDNDDVLKSDYKNFVQIFESIVAYHKYYGGQENNN
ncbi:MAG: type III-A CRISPR-associated protein Csm2 [Paludibacteraceae bacterium]|nr:type III-A CRISPR-associated protein Csm2 [Paludibacteraceae bacterium]